MITIAQDTYLGSSKKPNGDTCMIKSNEVARQVNIRDEYMSVKAVVRFKDVFSSGLIDKALYLAKLVGFTGRSKRPRPSTVYKPVGIHPLGDVNLLTYAWEG